MEQTPTESTQNLAERLCWQGARRDEPRIARRLSRQQVGEGVYRLDEGALLDDVFPCLQALGVMAMRQEVHGTGLERVMGPVGPYLLRDGVKPLCGMERLHALPARLCSEEALMQLVGFNAQQGRYGVCQRGAAPRQGERAPGPIGPATLAETSVTLNLPAWEVGCNGAIRALATAGGLAAQVTGMVAGTELETTLRSSGCGQVPRTVRIEDTRGRVHEIAVTGYGWNVLLLSDAATKRPLAVKVGTIEAHETPWTRALVTQARAQVAGAARRHNGGFDQGFLEGTALGWLDPQGLTGVVPANANRAVTADARAQAAAGEGSTVGRRVHTVRHGQGHAARTARREPEVVGSPGLTTDDHDGTAEPGRHAHRRDFAAHPLNAVVVRQWHGRDDGPGGKTVVLTNASGQQPLRPVDDADDRRRIEHCCRKATTQPWDLGHPPQKPERAVRVHGVCTWRMFALATASRLRGAQEATGGEPVGWQRWRRQLLQQTRDQVILVAQGWDGILHLAESSL